MKEPIVVAVRGEWDRQWVVFSDGTRQTLSQKVETFRDARRLLGKTRSEIRWRSN